MACQNRDKLLYEFWGNPTFYHEDLKHTNLNKEKTADFLIQTDQKENLSNE